VQKNLAYPAILLVSILAVVGVLSLDPIAQDLAYHRFIDQRAIFTIPNFWNIVSNLLFLYVGIAGLHGIFSAPGFKMIDELKGAYTLFFAAVLLVALGSGYYHLSPDNESLVWDRLPMAIAFMALFSIIIGEFVSVQLGKLVFWPLIILGAFSIIYWQYTEAKGIGDLRYYILVQGLPMLLIPLILLLFKSQFTVVSGYWMLLCAYGLAKVFEFFDAAIYGATLLLSGHSLKHITAGIGVLFLLNAFKKREHQPRVKGS
jgi:hypothetical protein